MTFRKSQTLGLMLWVEVVPKFSHIRVFKNPKAQASPKSNYITTPGSSDDRQVFKFPR